MPPSSSTSFIVVINHRRDDTAGHAGRLYDALAEHFGREQVFMDIDAIEPGVDFTKVIVRFERFWDDHLRATAKASAAKAAFVDEYDRVRERTLDLGPLAVGDRY